MFQAKHAKDEHDAAENARIDAAVAEADRKAQETAERLAEKRRVMQQECDKVRVQLVNASVFGQVLFFVYACQPKCAVRAMTCRRQQDCSNKALQAASDHGCKQQTRCTAAPVCKHHSEHWQAGTHVHI